MPWVRFDDQFTIHRKVDSLSDSAFRLHVAAIFWCSRNLTDGFVPENELESAAPRRIKRPGKFVPELVDRALWREVDGGWEIHDYLSYQPSKEKVERERAAKAVRQQRWIDKKRRTEDTSRDASQDAAPPRPAPKEGGGGDAPAAPGRRAGASGRAHPSGSPVRAVPEWCGNCDETTRLLDLDQPRRCPNCHPLRDAS